jgi:hypothetical protein
MYPWLSRTLVVAVALGVTGCASLSNVQTADTLGKGNVQVGIEPGLWGVAGNSGATVIPHVDASIRYGVADRVDLGVRAGSSFFELQSKFLLTTPGDPKIAVSIAPTFGGLVALGTTSGGSGSAGLLNIGLPVLIGFKTRGGSEFVIGPRLQNILLFGSGGGSGAVYLMGLGGSFGFFWRIADKFGLLPEIAAVYPVVGAAAASGVGSTGLQWLYAEGLMMQFKLGVMIGGGRKPGQRPNEDLRQAPPPQPPMPPPGGDAPPPPPPPPPL